MPAIIWDWNGTLLNDLDFCISTINSLLDKRSLPLMNRNRYKEVFSFPVKNYYEAIGFDFTKEDFSVPAREFIDLYNNGVNNCLLHDSAHEILTHFKKSGVRQFVLSAMKQDMLELTLKMKNVIQRFEGIFGLDDHYAVSKVERGKHLLDQFGLDRKDTWIIGDTLHDYEVAEQLELQCILVADGHQSSSRLRESGVPVIDNLGSLKDVPFFNVLDKKL